MGMTRSNIRGFTLIELLVVIAIIGILSSVVLASMNTARAKGRDARRKADLEQLATAVQMYYDDHGYLPRNGSGWCTYISNTNSGWGAAFQADIVPTYLRTISLDPTKANATGDYFYSNDNNTAGQFTLCATLEQSTGNSYTQWSGCAGWSTGYNYCISYK
jgi:prepilin-type N-terminal cleavage/methylation domain-containing protein